MSETIDMDDFDPAALISAFEAHPGQTGTVTIPQLTAGALIRRYVRSALDSARVLGAYVDAHEQKGLLDSVFAIRMRGTGDQLMPALRTLRDLGGEQH